MGGIYAGDKKATGRDRVPLPRVPRIINPDRKPPATQTDPCRPSSRAHAKNTQDKQQKTTARTKAIWTAPTNAFTTTTGPPLSSTIRPRPSAIRPQPETTSLGRRQRPCAGGVCTTSDLTARSDGQRRLPYRRSLSCRSACSCSWLTSRVNTRRLLRSRPARGRRPARRGWLSTINQRARRPTRRSAGARAKTLPARRPKAKSSGRASEPIVSANAPSRWRRWDLGSTPTAS